MSTALPSESSTRRAVLGDLARAAPAGLLLAAVLAVSLDRSATFALLTLAVYAAVGTVILRLRPDRLPAPGIGAANRVTLARVVSALPLAALLLDPRAPGPEARWWIVGLGAVALMLDGVDGWVARRTGTGTAFGARFDMEADAALLAVLSGLAWRSGAVGAWVLLIGALRYLFVAAGVVVPRLRGELPPRMRRKVICVVQGVALLIAVAPVVPAPMAVGVAGGALAALVVSFAIDVRILLRPAPSGQSSSRSASSASSIAA